ncbi:MAG: bifunctional adenosylcobinamide kinase/adenosylcobinamide-phosphate guanylyltransferase [Candidatus Omnitrophica bacterium]|nr:bifunctional adenosylcobinamide kinase/adenosylcobinamide-phosphate guanylyltransferase [Candidatus Omnitrophota bacterium]
MKKLGTFPRRGPSGFFVGLASQGRTPSFRVSSSPPPTSLDPRCFILITGGTRSGKSRFAVELAGRFNSRIVYLATCRSGRDGEMRERIARHRRARPRGWTTIEHPRDLAGTITRLRGKAGGLIIDCLTMYVAELVVRGESDAAVQRKVRALCRAIRRVSYPVIMVTNEVGSSVVPEQELGRRFRDLAGLANQIAAGFADHVFLLVAGIPLALKGGDGLFVDVTDGTNAPT